MEGLEISEVNKSEIRLEDRADAEYYQKENLRIEHLLESDNTKALSDISQLVASAFYPAATHLYEIGDMPFLRCVDTVNFPVISRLQNETLIKIPSEFAEDSKGINFLEKDDICLTKVGTPCFASVIHDHTKIAMSRTVMGIRKIREVDPYYLMVFLRSYYGFSQLYREREQTIQFQLTLDRVGKVRVLIPSTKLQKRIAMIARDSFEHLHRATTLHQQAEETLLSSVGLKDWQPPTPLTYETKASDAFALDRLDAEFFQPRIKELYQLLGDKAQCVRDVADLRQDRFNGTKNPFNYLEIGAVSTDGIIADSIIDGDEAPSRATWHVERGDVLTSTVRPIRGLTAIIEDSQHGSVASSGFAVLTPKGISPELLLCYLKLPQICELMDLHTSASMYPAISVSDILGLPFKHPGKKAEEKIISLIQEARAKRANSKFLLERAKRAVEIAIEESEETALAYLDGKHYLADELLPKLFSPNRHYIDLATVQRTIEAEALVYEASTINRYLHEWTKEGRIHDAGRGWYSDLPRAFQPVLETAPLPELATLLKKRFPLLEFTVWSTRQFTPFFHHHAARHATFLMVDRDGMEPVADALVKAGHHVVVHPLGEVAKHFCLTHEDTIILRPRLSSDHNETFAPIEQMLVDFHHEIQKLGLFELAEFQRIFENLANRYRLNVPALKRYAERRKTDSTELLKIGGII